MTGNCRAFRSKQDKPAIRQKVRWASALGMGIFHGRDRAIVYRVPLSLLMPPISYFMTVAV